MNSGIKYSIFNPTGNITALVETKVDIESQPAISDEIMKRHPEVEQVGFVCLEPENSIPINLRMAGGEFCGNAAISAAALYAIRSGIEACSVNVRVNGAPKALEVRLAKAANNPSVFDVELEMPEPLSIERIMLETEGVAEELPVVDMGGISHIIIEESRKLYALKDSPKQAEKAVKSWCRMLGADCLGLMFLSGEETELTPLVYVPSIDTVFWENSCASGSSAVGMYLADKMNAAVEVSLKEPAGILRVKSGGEKDYTWLFGSTILEMEDFF